MQLAYPIVHILFYIAMLFAPPDADRVSITGPDESFELTRISGEWKFTSKEVSGTATTKDGKAILTVNGKAAEIPAASLVAAAIGHDWTKQPKDTLQDQNTLEKTADGFVLRTDDGKPGMKEYRITFRGPETKTGGTSINVLGTVKQPGTYQVEAGAGVPAAVAAAGGLTEKVNRVECRILRGEGGAISKGVEVPWEAILNIAANGPKLADHDTIYIKLKTDPVETKAAPMAPMIIPIKIAADGTLTVADQACPSDQLADKLRKLAENNAVSVEIHADEKAPFQQVSAILDICKAAGIENLKLGRSKEPK